MEQELLASVLMASTHGVPSDPPLVAECRAKYSQYVTELVLIEAIESKNYTAFIAPVSLQTAGTIFNGDMSAEALCESDNIHSTNATDCPTFRLTSSVQSAHPYARLAAGTTRLAMH